MSGSMEEGVILQLKNPSHTAVGRMAFLGGAVVGTSSLIAMLIWVPELGPAVPFGLAIFVFIVSTILLYRWIRGRRLATRADRSNEIRAERARESDALIAKMKKEGQL